MLVYSDKFDICAEYFNWHDMAIRGYIIHNTPQAMTLVHVANQESCMEPAFDMHIYIYIYIYQLKGLVKCASGLQENPHKLKFTQVKNTLS
jgi:hypothetical protein